MGELRVALPGAEVLFAFLLTFPFTARFGSLTAAERSAYFVAFIAAAAACSLLIAPSSLRVFPDADGRPLLRRCARLAIAGLAALSLRGLTAVVVLVSRVGTGASWRRPSHPALPAEYWCSGTASAVAAAPARSARAEQRPVRNSCGGRRIGRALSPRGGR